MTHIPKLYETAEAAREPEVSENLAPLTAARTEARAEVTGRRRKVAAVVAAILLAPIVVKGAINSYGYGYHPDQNTAAHTAGHNTSP
jgi:hypothetical protein